MRRRSSLKTVNLTTFPQCQTTTNQVEQAERARLRSTMQTKETTLDQNPFEQGAAQAYLHLQRKTKDSHHTMQDARQEI